MIEWAIVLNCEEGRDFLIGAVAASENWYLAAEPRLGRLTERWSSAKRATYLRTPFFEARLPAFPGARHPAATSRRLLTVIVNWPALMRNGSAAP